jgi:hypothetical protein
MRIAHFSGITFVECLSMRVEFQSIGYRLLWHLLFPLMSSAVFAQSLEISKNPDFSTADKAFTFNETLYARVTAPQIDFNNLDKNEYSLKSNNFSDEERGALVNNRNSTYTIALALSLLNRAEHNW